MRKSLPRFLLSGAILALTATSVLAAPTLEEQMQSLKRQNHQQSIMLQKMQERLDTMEQKQSSNHVEPVGVSGEPTEPASLIQAINDHVELSVLAEVEGSSADNFAGEDTSDIVLATVEIGLDATVSEWSSAHILLLYEEGEENDHLMVDEGTITIGNLEKFPFYLTAGKMYVPYGNFESNMVSDPLTLEIGETGDSAIQIGFEAGGFYGSIYGFNGDVNEAGEHGDYIDNFGANAGFTMENDIIAMDVGLGYITNIGDTDGLGDFLDGAVASEVKDYVDGISAHAIVTVGPFSMVAEYLAALDDFELGEIDFDGSGAEPKAYNFEVAFSTELIARETTFAIGYQATDEALALELPESRIIGTASMEIMPYTALAVEYFHDEDYSRSDGGTGNDADTLTIQLALEF